MIGIQLFLVHKVSREVASCKNGDHGNGVYHKYVRCTLRGIEPVNCTQVCRYPEKQEPPHSVGQKFAYSKRPGLFVFERLLERDLFTSMLVHLHSSFRNIGGIVLVDISQLEGIHFFILFRLVIDKHPETHPYKTECSNHDKSHFPAPCFGNKGDGKGCQQGTNLST